MSDRDVYIITKSPLEQYFMIKTKEIGSTIKPLNEYDNSVVVFDVFMGSRVSQISRSVFH